VLLSFVVSGVMGAFAGLMQVASSGSGDPSIGGIDFLVPALAGVFLGSTTWQPGRFNVPGTIIGLFFIGTTISGLELVGVAPWVTNVFNGVAVVTAIILSAQFRRRRTGTAEVGS
jgi:ribose transport system permease protein